MGPLHDNISALEACPGRADAPTCLLRNWRAYLAAFGQGELNAPAGERTYRAVIEPACNPAILIRLDVAPSGRARLTSVQAPNPSQSASFAERSRTVRHAQWRQTAEASPEDVKAVAHALRANWFDFITADPSALLIRDDAYDGMTAIVEADVNGRYRYVARHSGEFNSEQVRKMADSFLELAAKRTPGFRPIHPC